MIELNEQQVDSLRTALSEECGIYLFGNEVDKLVEVVAHHVIVPSFSKSIEQNKEELNMEEPHFKGEAYEKKIDQTVLKKDFFKVFFFLCANPGWHLDTEIADKTGVYVPSVQRYRSYMRSVEWGSHEVERRRREGMRIFEYRLIPNKESLTYGEYLKTL